MFSLAAAAAAARISGAATAATAIVAGECKNYEDSDNDPNKAALIALIGDNKYNTDWNYTQVNAGLNAFIGYLRDGSVGTIQTMPWNFRPWGCGSGIKGSCNNGWIQFEICEDNL